MKKSYIFILASVALSGCASKEASEADIQALLNKYYGSYCEYLNTSNLKKIKSYAQKDENGNDEYVAEVSYKLSFKLSDAWMKEHKQANKGTEEAEAFINTYKDEMRSMAREFNDEVDKISRALGESQPMIFKYKPEDDAIYKADMASHNEKIAEMAKYIQGKYIDKFDLKTQEFKQKFPEVAYVPLISRRSLGNDEKKYTLEFAIPIQVEVKQLPVPPGCFGVQKGMYPNYFEQILSKGFGAYRLEHDKSKSLGKDGLTLEISDTYKLRKTDGGWDLK